MKIKVEKEWRTADLGSAGKESRKRRAEDRVFEDWGYFLYEQGSD